MLDNEINNAIDYIENHLNHKINYKEIAKQANCSLTKLQQLFLLATNMTLSDYIKKRRMTLASQKLIENSKVIDLAYEYGYESPESFSRAFKSFHGFSPLNALKLKSFKSQERISLSIVINEKNATLGSFPVVRIESFKEQKAYTFRYNGNNPEEETYLLMRKWVLENLDDYLARRIIAYAPSGHHPKGTDDNDHPYVVQVFLHKNEQIKSSAQVEISDVPNGMYLVGDSALSEYDEDGKLDIGLSMTKSSQEIYHILLSMKNYQVDIEKRCFIEEQIFNKTWFENPNKPGQFKFWLPIKSFI